MKMWGAFPRLLDKEINMKNSSVALGKAAAVEAGVSIVVKPETVEERLVALEAKIELLIKSISTATKGEKRGGSDPDSDINKDGIPFYLNLIGVTRGTPYVLSVMPDAYYIGNRPYATLSAAAKAVSGVRRSGWTFWKLPNGRTAKEAFKRKTKK